MYAFTSHGKRFLLACIITCAMVCTAVPSAHADEDELAQLQGQLDATVQKIESAAQDYQAATDEVTSLAAQIAQNEARAAEIQEKLPEQRQRTASSIKTLYLFQQSSPGLLELMLSSESFGEFISTLRYIDAIHEHNVYEVEALASLEDELTQTQAQLNMELSAATGKQDEALEALDQVRRAREDLQAQTQALAAQAASDAARAEAERLAEESAQAAEEAVADLPEDAQVATTPSEPSEEQDDVQDQESQTDEQEPEESKQPEEAEPEEAEPEAEQPDEEPQEEPEEQAQEEPAEQPVEQSEPAGDNWAARIDAYLAGSPLAGYGSVFAEAAAAYGVDPRLSPAIACIESGKGQVCFLPHNAWGWGSASWPDWNSAIHGHVSGFASGYGSTITLEGARMYAGTDMYVTWYNLVQAQMSMI